MTGMSCRGLLKKLDPIMDDITTISIQRRKERVDEKQPYGIMSKDHLETRLQVYRETFQLIDAVFGGLRTIAPTRLEIEQTLEAITFLEYYWVKKLKLSITPKAHLAFRHSVKKVEDEEDEEEEEDEEDEEDEIELTGDMVVFGGVGDKTDEWGEKWHQEMDKQATKTRGMNCFKLQCSTMIKSLWRDSDPSVRSKLDEGLKKTSRGAYKSDGISPEDRRKARRQDVIRIRQKVELN
jgi:hypothetical protein